LIVHIVGVLSLMLLAACTPAAEPTTSLSSAPARTTSTPAPLATAQPTATPLPNCGEQTAVSTTPPTTADITLDQFTLINTFPHDPTAFTQGLEWVDGQFVEGTGLYGLSHLRVVDIATGEVQQEVPLEPAYFGEGITVLDGKIFQITWQEQTAFVYDLATLAQEKQFSYPTQGWGLTDNGRCLIMSDGSSTITFRDPDTFAELGQITVIDDNGPITQINELEYINGEIYANIWKQNRIARISPKTGHVLGWLLLDDLTTIVSPTNPDDVLNGIAYHPETGHLYVTGKRWPLLFEIKINQ